MKGQPITLTISVPMKRKTALCRALPATQYGPVAVAEVPGGTAIVHVASRYPLVVLPTRPEAARAVAWLLARGLDWSHAVDRGRAVFANDLSAAVAAVKAGL